MQETEEEETGEGGKGDLEAEVLAEEGVGLREEARGAPRWGRRGVHGRAEQPKVPPGGRLRWRRRVNGSQQR